MSLCATIFKFSIECREGRMPESANVPKCPENKFHFATTKLQSECRVGIGKDLQATVGQIECPTQGPVGHWRFQSTRDRFGGESPRLCRGTDGEKSMYPKD